MARHNYDKSQGVFKSFERFLNDMQKRGRREGNWWQWSVDRTFTSNWNISSLPAMQPQWYQISHHGMAIKAVHVWSTTKWHAKEVGYLWPFISDQYVMRHYLPFSQRYATIRLRSNLQTSFQISHSCPLKRQVCHKNVQVPIYPDPPDPTRRPQTILTRPESTWPWAHLMMAQSFFSRFFQIFYVVTFILKNVKYDKITHCKMYVARVS